MIELTATRGAIGSRRARGRDAAVRLHRRHAAGGYEQRGAALLLVMWLLALLTGLLGAFALTARTEALQGRQLRSGTAARYAAQAGIEMAVVRMLDGDQATRWVPDGRDYAFGFEGSQLQVRITDESGKVDLNMADIDTLSRLFLALQVEEPRARALAAAIIDWRDPDDLLQIDGAESPQYAAGGLPYGAKNRNFDTVAELQQVLGMDYALYRDAADLVTVYSGQARPNPAFAPPLVLAALGMDPAQAALAVAQRQGWDAQSGMPAPTLPDGSSLVASSGSGTYSIASRAIGSDRSIAELFATVRAGATGPYGKLYAPLQWREGEPL